MKVKIAIAVSAFFLLALIAFSQIGSQPFAPAKDFPRDALIYVQIADLPAMIKFWNESKFRENYTASENFLGFKNRHLGRKLASRWEEFNAATGFTMDAETLAKLANNQAAMAVYDIGKLEFVFIAPVSDDVFAATVFFQKRENFKSETLADGTEIRRVTVKSDRGRQSQELIFANLKNRFVLATSEKLFVQTLNNIKNSKNKDSLGDAASLTVLSENFTLHSATVWVNQSALNDDYYFKRYWLMSDVKDLKNIRAGIFDFEMQEGKCIERRRFLLDKNVETSPIPHQQAEKLLTFLPADTPFYRLRKATGEIVSETIHQTISEQSKKTARSPDDNFYYFQNDNYSSGDYENLSEDYDEMIDDGDEETTVESTTDFDFSKILAAANPTAVLTFTAPKALPAPLFVEFQRAAIYHLAEPDAFNQTEFESAVEREISGCILISSPGVKLNWETKVENDISRRELKMPMIGWEISYARRGSELILSNNTDLLLEMLTVKTSELSVTPDKSFDELTVLNLAERENAFDRIFGASSVDAEQNDFFNGNVSSLLDSLSDVKRIEIRKNHSHNVLEEQLDFIFQ